MGQENLQTVAQLRKGHGQGNEELLSKVRILEESRVGQKAPSHHQAWLLA